MVRRLEGLSDSTKKTTDDENENETYYSQTQHTPLVSFFGKKKKLQLGNVSLSSVAAAA